MSPTYVTCITSPTPVMKFSINYTDGMEWDMYFNIMVIWSCERNGSLKVGFDGSHNESCKWCALYLWSCTVE